MKKPKVKICCISSIEEARLAIEFGASAIGLVSKMPSGPGVISEEQIISIVKTVPKKIQTFLLSSKQDSGSIIHQVKRCKTDTIQIVDRLLEGTYADIKKELPNIQIVQVIHVNNEKSIDEAVRISHFVDSILLDSGNQDPENKVLGGTGRTHNWSISKKIVDSIDIPVYLAGGLNSRNVIDAVSAVQPYGIDLCSGVRTNDKLDVQKLSVFFNAVHSI